jgi:hypothetical protein
MTVWRKWFTVAPVLYSIPSAVEENSPPLRSHPFYNEKVSTKEGWSLLRVGMLTSLTFLRGTIY